MKSKRSLRFFSNTLTAAGLALAVSACSTLYPAQGKHDWDQSTDVPDLNEPAQRSQALLDYCKRLHSRGDLNLAAGICNRAHEINPTDPAPLVQLARVMEDLEQTASAEEAYRAALLLDPEQTDALYGLGKIYIDQQRYEEAVEPLEVAAQQDTDDPRIYNALGVIKDQQGQHSEAQAYYRQGLGHSPRNVSLRNNLGLSMVLDGQPEAGLAMLRDVAAEPAAGATTGRNLEMASQIAANGVAAATADQTAMGGPMLEDDAVASQELESLAPSAAADTTDTTDAPASEPLTLLETAPPAHAGASDTAPPSLQELPPPNASSLDMELADTMSADTPDTASAADSQGTQTMESGPQAAADEASDTSRDWSGTAQTAFEASKAANDNSASDTVSTTASTTAGDAPAATQTSLTSAEASAAPAETPSPDTSSTTDALEMAPASAPETAPQTAAISGGYGIDEDTFFTAQLGSYRTEAHAREGWQVLKDSAGELLADSDAFIVRADLGGDKGIYYRVRAGTLSDHAAAKRFCQDLQAQGVDCMPVEASWQTTNETLVDKICQSGSTGALCGSAGDPDAARGGTPHAKG